MTVQTLTLTDFLLARIWDDETIARACGTTRASGTHPANVAAHIVRHDPARILAECEAKRRIVDFATDAERLIDGEWCVDHSENEGWRILAALALPYADHPDYRQEWKP